MPFSPPQSVASSSSLASPLTIKKLVLDGKSKSEGASFRIYMKVSLFISRIDISSTLIRCRCVSTMFSLVLSFLFSQVLNPSLSVNNHHLTRLFRE